MRELIKHSRMAVGFLTRLPVWPRETVDYSARDWQWCPAYFPLAGYALSVLTFGGLALLHYGFQLDLSRTGAYCALFCVTFLAYLTRGLHLDGLADVCDGFGGAHTAEKRLAIMKDSTNGSYAVIGLCLLIITKVVALAELLANGFFLQCVGTLVLSRFFLTWLNGWGRYPREKGAAMLMVGQVPVSAVILAAVLVSPVLFIPGMVLVAAVMGAVMVVLKRQADRLIGGVTGDVLGAACELCETAGYVVSALILCS